MAFGFFGQVLLVAILIVALVWGVLKIEKLRLKIINKPSDEEEAAWRQWIHDNLNEGKDDPKESHYSLLCVVGWSRFNIVIFVVIPFLFAALGSIIFGVVWSQDFHSHKGDVSGGWAIAAFIITLAAGLCQISTDERYADDISSYIRFSWDHRRSRVHLIDSSTIIVGIIVLKNYANSGINMW